MEKPSVAVDSKETLRRVVHFLDTVVETADYAVQPVEATSPIREHHLGHQVMIGAMTAEQAYNELGAISPEAA